MIPTRILRQAAAAEQHRTPLIKFLGKRSSPSTSVFPFPPPILLISSNPPPATNTSSDPSPEITPPENHPASPSASLPDSFVQYRSNAQQHGPLGHRARTASSSSPPQSPQSSPSGASGATIGSRSGRSLGSIEPPPGQYFDRSELPARFRRMEWTEAEIEAVESGGASVVL